MFIISSLLPNRRHFVLLLLLQQQQQPQLLPGRSACTCHGAQKLSASAALAAESAARLGNQCKNIHDTYALPANAA
jgi:hypothetical protein